MLIEIDGQFIIQPMIFSALSGGMSGRKKISKKSQHIPKKSPKNRRRLP